MFLEARWYISPWVKWVSVVLLFILGLALGYGYGAWQWHGKAVMQSYVIGFDHGYSTGASDASIPGAEVIEVGPDGKLISKRINPK